MSKLKLTDEQQAVIEFVNDGSGSLFVGAVAGSGKTFICLRSIPFMDGEVGYMAFNRSVAIEMDRKIKALPNYQFVQAKTCHSFGFAALRKIVRGRVFVKEWDKKKLMLEKCNIDESHAAAVLRMVSIAKQTMCGKLWDIYDLRKWERLIDHFGILNKVQSSGDDELDEIDLIEEASECIKWSKDQMTLIDFDDMIWLPLIHDAPVPKFDWIIVDECQDTNPARRLLAKRMMHRNSRSLWAGDRNQAIYGFTGADGDAVDQIVRDFHCQELPLTYSFRCSQKAAEIARQWVPQIKAAPGNKPGWLEEAPIDDYFHSLVPSDAILCRLTRPLVSLAFRLIRRGIGCYVEGRDIGKQLTGLATKWKVKTCSDLSKRLEGYRQHEIDKLISRDAEHLIEPLNDRIDTLFAIMDGCDTVRELTAKIDQLFKNSKGRDADPECPSLVTLSTVHKAKGREWDRVFILGFYQYMPSKWARREWEQEQEMNLMYVAVTRTRDGLIYAQEVE